MTATNTDTDAETDRSLTILVIVGTVRTGRNSIHPARHVTDLFQETGHDSELFDMVDYDIPYLDTVRYQPGDPHPDIETFGQKVEAADALVIVTPEYNRSIPGALKNLLDHLFPEYEGKPFSYVTVSAGGFGGVSALSHLHDITLEFDAHPGPELPVSNVADVFDEDGTLIDTTYEDKFVDFVQQTVEHAAQFSSFDSEIKTETVS